MQYLNEKASDSWNSLHYALHGYVHFFTMKVTSLLSVFFIRKYVELTKFLILENIYIPK